MITFIKIVTICFICEAWWVLADKLMARIQDYKLPVFDRSCMALILIVSIVLMAMSITFAVGGDIG